MSNPRDQLPAAGTAAAARPPGQTGPETEGRGASVGARMDRLPVTRTHRRVVTAVGLGLFFEFYEVFLAGVLSGVLTEEFGLTKAELPAVLASTFIGMFFGALLMGRFADRYGRRGAFLINLSLYSIFSLLGAFSPNALFLMGTRFLAGIGLGAEPPLADTYLTDLLPAGRRGRLIAWAYTLAFFGVPVVGFLGHGIAQQELLGLAGWRWMFIIGALGALLVLALRRKLPESPRWLESAGHTAEAERVTTTFEAEARAEGHTLATPVNLPHAAEPQPTEVRALFRAPYGRRTTMMVIFHLLQTFGYYGFGTMVPLVLLAKGYPVSQSLLFTALTFLGYPVGSALSLPIVERVERKFLVIGSLTAMVVFGLAFGFSTSMASILMFGFLYTTVSNIFSNSYHIYQAEIFPTGLRSTATSGTYALSRLSTAAMPFVLVPVLAGGGPAALFAVVSVAMAIVAINVAFLGPRTTGRSLEAVNDAA